MNQTYFPWGDNAIKAKAAAEKYAERARIFWTADSIGSIEIHVWQDPIHKQTTVEWEIKR